MNAVEMLLEPLPSRIEAFETCRPLERKNADTPDHRDTLFSSACMIQLFRLRPFSAAERATR